VATPVDEEGRRSVDATEVGTVDVVGNARAGSAPRLAIARGFAEVNGGRVWAESLEGQGANFVFALPLATVEAESLA
jgi:signal transduction histidine kinase